MLKEAQNPVVVIGNEFVSLEHYDALVRLVLFCKQNEFPVMIIKRHANSLAAAQRLQTRRGEPTGKGSLHRPG